MQGTVSLRSVHGKFLSAQPDGRADWNRDAALDWELFRVETRNDGKIALKGIHGMYVSAQPDGTVQINRRAAPPGGWEEFTVEGLGNNVICLKSVHGKYLSAQPDGTAQWNRDHAPPGGWEDIQFVPQVTQNQEQVSIKQQESIEILEAVKGKPVRFKIKNRPSSNDAWVGIYPSLAYDYDHGAQNKRWKWLRDIDVNNASFPKQVAGSHSIRVFSDGGYTLHARKNFHVETAEKPRRGRIGFATLFGIFLMLPGLPLLIIGSTSTSGDRLAMIIPGAILMSVGGFALLMSIVAVIQMGSTEGPLSVVKTGLGGGSSTKLEVLSFNHRQPIRFSINNAPLHNDAWVGLYQVNAEDRNHGDNWHYLRDIDVSNARFPGQEKGSWSLRVFTDGGYNIEQRINFQIIESDKTEVWMQDAKYGNQRLKGLIADHRNQFTKRITTSKIEAESKVGEINRFETDDTTYLVYDRDLQQQVNEKSNFWDLA